MDLPDAFSRRTALALAAGAAGCGRSPDPAAEMLPVQAGGYTRTETDLVPVNRTAEALRRLGVARVRRARYRGPGEITLTAHEMTSQAGAFEAVQKWRPVPGSLAFHAANLFLVAESAEVGNDELQRFAGAVERALR